MNKTNEKETVITLSGLRLNAYVLLISLPLWGLSSGPYVYVYGWRAYLHGIIKVLDYKIFIALFLGIVVHELLHAISWMLLQKEGFKHIKFGFNWQALTPYTHYTRAMEVWKYQIGGFMPGLLMGIIPVLLSYYVASSSMNFIGFLFVWAAAGDFISLWMLRKLTWKQLVQDHPQLVGVIVHPAGCDALQAGNKEANNELGL